MKSNKSLKLIKNVKSYSLIIIYCLEILVYLINFQDKCQEKKIQHIFYRMLSKTHNNMAVISAEQCLQHSYSASDYTSDPL